VTFRKAVRDGWPALLAIEVITGTVLGTAAVLGAPVTVLVACALLFGVIAPALGIFVTWAGSR
jgi:hypothetical protein